MVKKILLTIGIVIVLIVAAGGGYAWYLWHSVKSTANDIYKPAGESKGHEELKDKKPISFLLLGVDQRKGDPGRSDTIIAMTLNPKTNTMQMVSIPRDTRTAIIGHGTTDKINSAYAYGGTKMALDTVSHFLYNVPFDYYIRINMEGMKDLVDAVGGVTVTNDISWHDEGYYKKGYYYKKGKINLDTGAKAMGYIRMRHLDPRGDFGRNKRERDVIMAVINKAANISSVSHYTDILNAIKDNVTTNMTFDDMKTIATDYRNTREHTQDYEVKGQSTTINGIYYLVVSNAERQRVHDMIEEQLGNK